MSGRRRRGEDGEKHGASSGDLSEVPYREADEASGEKALDEIDDFRVSARDDKGGSLPSTTYGPPLLWRHVEIIIHSRRFPYLNIGDFVRHAVVRHIRFCASIRASIPRHLTPALESMLEVVRDDEQRVQVEAVLQRIKERVDYYLNKGETGDAVALIYKLKTRLDGLQPSFWQRAFTQAFYSRYAPYLEGKPLAVAGAAGTDGKAKTE